jgi:hypothetical protein
MAQRGSALVILVVGVVLALLSLFADALGIGGKPGFGYKQLIGLVIGVALAAYGVWKRR